MTITKSDLIKDLPSNMKGVVSDELVDMLNGLTTDQDIAENIRDNFVSYSHILQEGKYKLSSYLNAIAYVSYKHMGYSNKDAYFKVFPDKEVMFVAKGTSSSDIAAYVSAFHRGALVNKIMEQSLVPIWLLNQDIYQKAINTQAHLMQTAESEKVRCDAANSILTHLAKPKDVVTNINVDMRKSSGLEELTNTLQQLANAQIHAINNGARTKDITDQVLVREVNDDTN